MLIRESIEPRAMAMSWEAANETTKNRWRIRAWLEVLKGKNNAIK
jgi:hypothetical protein